MRDDPDYRAWVERGRGVTVETAGVTLVSSRRR
jgi:hypothetical protein